jgi:cation transport regulator ChaB
MLAALLRAHVEEVIAQHAADIIVDAFRAAIVENLGRAGDDVAVATRREQVSSRVRPTTDP